MPEQDQQVNFNAFHILVFILSINLLLYGNIDNIIDIINYITTLNSMEVMVIVAHILMIYFILSGLQFEIKFNASVKFDLRHPV